MKNKNIPELRFQGFMNVWEQRKMHSVFKKIRNAFVGTATPYYVDYGYFYLQSNNVKNGQINRKTEVFINKEFYEKQKDKWLHTGDLVMVQSGHVGHTAVIPEELEGTAAHALIMFQDYKVQADSDFLNFQFQTNEAQRKLENIATGNTIKHILASEMKNFEVNLPHFDEQSQLATFFKTLDQNITLQQQELTILKQTKQGFLQKMFPKEGEAVPEVRFPGFKDNWKEKKLGSIVEFYSGLTYSPQNIEKEGTLVLRSSNIQNGEVVDADNVYVNSKTVNSQNVAIGDVIVVVRNGSRNLIGKHASVKQKMPNTVIGAFMTGIRAETPSFINALLDSNRFTIEINKNLGATINQITTGNFKKMMFLFPTIMEQERIGAFFEKIDQTITLGQQELEALQQTKKAFLQKMFV